MTTIPDGSSSLFEVFLPDFGGKIGTRKGRNVRDGYARGWGLECGNLVQKIRMDPLYQDALRWAEGRSVLTETKRMNLFLIVRYFLEYIPNGHIIEFGSYKGGNALFIAYLVDKLYPGMKVFSLDTFSGMPPTETAIDAHGVGDFQDVDLDGLKTFAESNGIRNVEFVPGLFEETATTVLGQVSGVSLAHIDCDIYSAVSYCYNVVKEFMVPGGYMVFDDATAASCLGATEAVEELVIHRDGLHSEQIFPHYVFRAPSL